MQAQPPFRPLLEPLESRFLLAVFTDAAGWTVITPSPDSRLVYVSSSQGSDSNNGLSAASPVRTLAKAVSLVRPGMPDHLLLKRGDTWVGESFEQWSGGGGRSASEPKLIGAYGSGERPRILTQGLRGWSQRKNVTIDHLAIVGIHFEGNRTVVGLDRLAPGSGMLVEDCVFTLFDTGINVQGFYGTISDVRLRRSVVSHNASPTGGTSQGMYVDSTRNVALEENVFWKNGYMLPDRSDAEMQAHGVYFSANNDGAVVRGNLIADSSSHGLQMRAGGIVEDNLFYRNPIGFSFGLVNGGTLKPGGVAGSIRGNVVIEAVDQKPNASNPVYRGWAVEIGNVRPGGLSMRENIFAHDLSIGGYAAIQLEVPSGPSNPGDSPGLADLRIENNVVYDWDRAFNISPAYRFGGTGVASINDLTVRNNAFTMSREGYLVGHTIAVAPGEERWENNRYYDPAARERWFRVQGLYTDIDQWRALVEPTARVSRPSYLDPERSPAGYDASLGGAGTYDSIMGELTRRHRGTWDPRYTVTAVVQYIRAGFNMGPAVDVDLNVDGRISADDYLILDRAFLGRSPAGKADLNADGSVDAGDYYLMDEAFSTATAPAATSLAATSGPSPFSTRPVNPLPLEDDADVLA